jgi:hypothetical protein
MHRTAVTLREAVMFTVTMGRSLSVLSVAAAIAVASNSASAQVIVSSDGGGMVRTNVRTLVSHSMTVSDDSVRSYLTRFEPGVLDDESGDANVVTIVLDNDGTYIRSTARRAKVMQAVPGRVVAINGDEVRAIDAGSTRVFTINGDSIRALATSGAIAAPVIAAGGSVVALNTLHRTEGSAAPAMLAGVSSDEIAGIATKHYAPGEMGKGPVFVTFVYLK